jgi:hypothetical protein
MQGSTALEGTHALRAGDGPRSASSPDREPSRARSGLNSAEVR